MRKLFLVIMVFFTSKNNSMGPIRNLYASDGVSIGDRKKISSRVTQENSSAVKLTEEGIRFLTGELEKHSFNPFDTVDEKSKEEKIKWSKIAKEMTGSEEKIEIYFEGYNNQYKRLRKLLSKKAEDISQYTTSFSESINPYKKNQNTSDRKLFEDFSNDTYLNSISIQILKDGKATIVASDSEGKIKTDWKSISKKIFEILYKKISDSQKSNASRDNHSSSTANEQFYDKFVKPDNNTVIGFIPDTVRIFFHTNFKKFVDPVQKRSMSLGEILQNFAKESGGEKRGRKRKRSSSDSGKSRKKRKESGCQKPSEVIPAEELRFLPLTDSFFKSVETMGEYAEMLERENFPKNEEKQYLYGPNEHNISQGHIRMVTGENDE